MGLRILIVGDPSGRDDEGMKRVNGNLRDELIALGHSCLIDNGLSLKSTLPSWDKIVFTGGPTKNTLFKIAAMRLLHLKSEIIMCGLMPSLAIQRYLIVRRCVNRVISENAQMLALAKVNEIPTIQQTAATFSFQKFLRGRNRSKPVRSGKRLHILHVGHLNAKRNVALLASLCQKFGYSVTFLISSTEKEEPEERRRLEELGANIVSEYQTDLYDFYRQFDLYVFPVQRADAAIAMPISILEALLAGLNVLTTDFGDVSSNFRHSPSVEITNNLNKVTAAQIESLARKPIIAIEELKKFDTAQFAKVIVSAT